MATIITNFNILKTQKNENMPTSIQIDTTKLRELTINMNDTLNSNWNNLKQIQSTQCIQGIDVDQAIVEETNLKMKELEQDFADLCDAMKIMNELVLLDEEKLEEIEQNVITTDTTILETIPILEQALELKEEIDNKYIAIKVIGGVLAGGFLFGGIGAIFGIIPAVVGAGVGGGGGGIVGYLTKFFK